MEVATGEANGLGLRPITSQEHGRPSNGLLPQVRNTRPDTATLYASLANPTSPPPPQVAVEIPNVKRVKMRRDSQYPTKRDHMICKCLTLSITYAATIGGLITITGTSTNLIFAEQFNTYAS